jgi:hypothetical protein
MAKQNAERAEFQREAKEKFGRLNQRYYPEQIKEYINGGQLDVGNLATYLASEFVLLIPQNQHDRFYDEACLPQYGDAESQFLGYRMGEPVISTLLKNRSAIWGCYAMKNTKVLQEEERFTARLDLNGFCHFARDAAQLEAR